MKSLIAIISLFLVANIAHAGKLRSINAAMEPQLSEDPTITLDSLLNPVSKVSAGVTGLRLQMLTDAGKTVGFRAGIAARARVLIHALKSRSKRLDTIFQFSSLLNKNGTLPPVIVEARDVAAFAPEQIRTANRVYKIEKEERFVSIPPTWRDYLFVGLPMKGGVDMPVFEARPQNGKEEAIWRTAVKAGWEDGQRQADAILMANFNRLTRDYTGMLRYSTLLQQGMISMTQVAERQQTVTGNSKQLMLGDKLRRVISKASFETNANKWRPSINRGHAAVPKSVTTLAAVATPVLAVPKIDVAPVNNNADTVQSVLEQKKAKPQAPVMSLEHAVQDKAHLTTLPPTQLWTIESHSTLRDTLTAWAHIAGWKTPRWKASNLYQVVSGAQINGSFLDALQALANAVPQIDITALMDRNELVITDAAQD